MPITPVEARETNKNEKEKKKRRRTDFFPPSAYHFCWRDKFSQCVIKIDEFLFEKYSHTRKPDLVFLLSTISNTKISADWLKQNENILLPNNGFGKGYRKWFYLYILSSKCVMKKETETCEFFIDVLLFLISLLDLPTMSKISFFLLREQNSLEKHRQFIKN